MAKMIDMQEVADKVRKDRSQPDALSAAQISEKVTSLEKARQNRLGSLALGTTQSVEVQKRQQVDTNTTPATTQPQEDQLTSFIEQGKIMLSPFNLLTLSTLDEVSSELGQCIDAMVANIEGYGHRLVPRVKIKEDTPKAIVDEVRAEHTRLVNFFAYANIDHDFVTLRGMKRRDEELTGNGYWEVIRDIDGNIQGFEPVASHQISLGRQEQDPIPVDVPILEMQDDNSVEVKTVQRHKRFRKYLQTRAVRSRSTSISSSANFRWYKEYQDPRAYDNRSGEELTKKADQDKARSEGRLANELMHFKLYSPRSAYGLPRFIGNILSIYGDRAAEEINYITIRNNNVPSMAFLVSNGQLTEGTLNRIESFVESQIKGSDNYSKFLIIEAEPPEEEGEDGGQVKLDIKPLSGTQQKDAMFQKYGAANKDQIRRSFRLPPILVGRSDDYTRATADSSIRIADEQIFQQPRNQFDEWVNRRLFPAMDVKYHKFKSNSPNTTDNSELVKILGGSEKTGGMTPNIAQIILSDVLGITLPDMPEDFPGDVPFSLTMAEAVKNQADPTEPGQQLTALKSLQSELAEESDEAVAEIAKTKDFALKGILKLRGDLEDAWTSFEDEQEDAQS